MNYNFSGKRTVVTGASGGLGRVLVSKLHKCGAQVTALDINEEGLRDLKLQMPEVEIITVDLLDWNATQAAGTRCGQVDMLINCAGIVIVQTLDEIDEGSLDKVVGINFKATVNLCQVISRSMVASGKGGSIVNVSSRITSRPREGVISYAASKAAVDLATQTMALELGKHQIRVNAVNPSFMATPLGYQFLEKCPGFNQNLSEDVPLGRITEPADVVGVILFLLSDSASMVSGVTLNVTGGQVP